MIVGDIGGTNKEIVNAWIEHRNYLGDQKAVWSETNKNFKLFPIEFNRWPS